MMNPMYSPNDLSPFLTRGQACDMSWIELKSCKNILPLYKHDATSNGVGSQISGTTAFTGLNWSRRDNPL